jgi:hypothetical protein
MVSLGPSLKVGNGVLSELLRHRSKLFSSPPPEPAENVTDLIDFGTTDIAPPTLGPIATIPLKSEQGATSEAEIPGSQSTEEGSLRQRRPPKLASKPSLTKLFSGSSRNLANLDDLRPPTPSLVDAEPPRVDLTIAELSPLPVFSDVPSPPIADVTSPVETTPPPSIDNEKKKLDDFQYPSGTVQERSEVFSSPTPIADLFVRKSPHAPLRNDRDSGGSSSIRTSTSVGSLPRGSTDNPASVVRRGQSVFFSGSSSDKRNSLRSAPNTPGEKHSSGSISVKDMIKDLDKRDS